MIMISKFLLNVINFCVVVSFFLIKSLVSVALISLFKLLKPVSTYLNLSISNLSASDFKLAKSVFLANSDLSTPVTFFK